MCVFSTSVLQCWGHPQIFHLKVLQFLWAYIQVNTYRLSKCMLHKRKSYKNQNVGSIICRIYFSPMIHEAVSSVQFIQFSRSVVSDSLRPHELQHARPPCPSIPGVHPNSCPSSRWCHPAISSSVIPFSSCPQSLPASGSFPMSQFFTWGGQKDWSFSFSISPSKEHPGLMSFRMDWLDLLAIHNGSSLVMFLA